MEKILQLCYKPEEDKKLAISNDTYIAVLFQNISYTSSHNYAKWYYSNYNGSERRDRSYSLDTQYDFDYCLTDRTINRTSSMETILEYGIDFQHIDDYYSPIYKELIPIFEKNLTIFPKRIESIPFTLNGEKCRFKYFINKYTIYITVLISKNIKLSEETTLIDDKYKVSSTITQFWNKMIDVSKIADILFSLGDFEKVHIVSHYKNAFFTDYMVHTLSRAIYNIYYTTINPQQHFPISFYKKLAKECYLTILTNCSLKYSDKNTIKYSTLNDGICCGIDISNHYRKNLKHITLDIFADYPDYV